MFWTPTEALPEAVVWDPKQTRSLPFPCMLTALAGFLFLLCFLPPAGHSSCRSVGHAGWVTSVRCALLFPAPRGAIQTAFHYRHCESFVKLLSRLDLSLQALWALCNRASWLVRVQMVPCVAWPGKAPEEPPRSAEVWGSGPPVPPPSPSSSSYWAARERAWAPATKHT